MFLSYFEAKNLSNFLGGFAATSSLESASLLTHSFGSTASNFNPAYRSAGRRSLVQENVFAFVTFATMLPASLSAISATALATTSTGVQLGDSCSFCSAPVVRPDCMMSGIASVSFQTP